MNAGRSGVVDRRGAGEVLETGVAGLADLDLAQALELRDGEQHGRDRRDQEQSPVGGDNPVGRDDGTAQRRDGPPGQAPQNLEALADPFDQPDQAHAGRREEGPECRQGGDNAAADERSRAADLETGRPETPGKGISFGGFAVASGLAGPARLDSLLLG